MEIAFTHKIRVRYSRQWSHVSEDKVIFFRFYTNSAGGLALSGFSPNRYRQPGLMGFLDTEIYVIYISSFSLYLRALYVFTEVPCDDRTIHR